MREGLEFAVYVGYEVLGAFREVEDSLEIDDLSRGGRRTSESLREEFEHTAVGVVFADLGGGAGGSVVMLCHRGTVFRV